MGWLYRLADQHRCVLPHVGDAQPGDIWQCDDCFALHQVADSQRDGTYWEALQIGSEQFRRAVDKMTSFGIEAPHIMSS